MGLSDHVETSTEAWWSDASTSFEEGVLITDSEQVDDDEGLHSYEYVLDLEEGVDNGTGSISVTGGDSTLNSGQVNNPSISLTVEDEEEDGDDGDDPVEEAQFEITSVDVPSVVESGDLVEASVTIKNTGDAESVETITYEGDIQPNGQTHTDSRTIGLNPEDEMTVTFDEFPVVTGDSIEHTFGTPHDTETASTTIDEDGTIDSGATREALYR